MWTRRSALLLLTGMVAALGGSAWLRLLDRSGWGRSVWIGATTPSTVTVTVGSSRSLEGAVLVASPEHRSASQERSTALAPDAEHSFARGTITGLRPDTLYSLKVRAGRRSDERHIGSFRTPPEGWHSFTFGMASCAATGSEARVFETIRTRADRGELDFFVHTGDLHYANVEENDASLYHAAFDRVFDSPRQNALWRVLPMYYMWDDHDFGPNASHGGIASRQAAVLAYRARVPSPPLADASPEGPVHYSFVRGRVRFVVTDLRSEKSDPGSRESPAKAMLGPMQERWFARELREARRLGQVACWVNTQVWLGEDDPQADRWFGYVHARRKMAETIAAAQMNRSLFVISGDMHALAYDDGGNNVWGGFPVLQAAPLDQSASQKGGPYSAGPFPADEDDDVNISQYGVVHVEDRGEDELRFRFVGVRVDQVSGSETVVLDQTFTLDAPAPS